MARPTRGIYGSPLLKAPPLAVSSNGPVSDGLRGALRKTQDSGPLWFQAELSLHINVRELRVVPLACQMFQAHLEGRCVSIDQEYTIAMFYINRQAGARSSPLCQEVLTLWNFCIAHSIHLEASYLSGAQNELADHLS